MELTIEAEGDIAERSELLNGTESATLQGASADGWALSGLVSWSIGVVEYAGEGDITLSSGDDALFGTVTSAVAREADDGGEELGVCYDIDGGEGRFEAAAGTIEAVVRLDGPSFRGRWALTVVP